MKTRKRMLILSTVIALFALSVYISHEDNFSISNFNVEKIAHAYDLTKDPGDGGVGTEGCHGSSCTASYDDENTSGSLRCCRRYTLTTGKRDLP